MADSYKCALIVVSVLFLSQNCPATVSTNDFVSKEVSRIVSEPNMIGNCTNLTESLPRNLCIIHVKEISNDAEKRSSTILGHIGLSDTLQGVLIAGLMSGIGMLFRMFWERRKEVRQYKAILDQETRTQKRRIKNERKKAYLDFMAFFLLTNNWFRMHNDPTMSEEERQKYDNLLPPESVAKAAEINARMRLFASKEVAEAHLKFMDAFKVIYSALDKDVEKRAADVGKMLIMISDAMNKELCQTE